MTSTTRDSAPSPGAGLSAGCPVAHGAHPVAARAAALAQDHDGYFAPDSISWRVFADPSTKLGGVAAILLQALNPMMMRVFEGTSGYTADVDGRAERTGRYLETTVFGDRAHADAAAEAVRRLHARSVWTDPGTGEELRADTQEWLVWTHNTLVWGLLRSSETFGPVLSPTEQDRFIVEQHAAAELVGIDLAEARLASTRAELDAYIDGERTRMALSLPAAEISRSLRAPKLTGNPITVWAGVIVQDAILYLLPDWARLLYGIEGRPMNMRSAARLTRRLISRARRKTGTEALITEITERVQTHPYRKVRTR